MSNRVGDYCGFAVRFVGLGYLVLWPLASPDPFGLARFCRPEAPRWYLLCHWPHLLNLTPGLHLLGIVCAGALGIQFALRAGGRWRQMYAPGADRSGGFDAASMPSPQRAAFRTPPRKIKPRSEFGLRSAPRPPRDSGVSSQTKPP